MFTKTISIATGISLQKTVLAINLLIFLMASIPTETVMLIQRMAKVLKESIRSMVKFIALITRVMQEIMAHIQDISLKKIMPLIQVFLNQMVSFTITLTVRQAPADLSKSTEIITTHTGVA